jgi:6-phosphogluconolactonase
MHTWHTFDSTELAAQAAASRIAKLIELSLQQNNICHIALPGGNTPAKCFQYLSQKNINWQHIHWYLGDERCLPVGHAERNDVMIQQHLWSKIQAPDKTIHTIPTELGATEAAAKYAAIINNITLDIAFLGMGEDGHTASLFPDNIALKDSHSVVPVFNAPKPPADRVSLSVTTLQRARHRIVLTMGEGKRQAIIKIKNQVDFPVNRIGDIEWFVDAAASEAI